MAAAALELVAGRAAAPPLPAGERAGRRRWRVADLLCLSFLGLLVAQTGRIPVLTAGGGVKQAPILVNDILLMTVLGAAFVVALRSRTLRLDRTALLALSFAAVGGGSALLAIPRFGLTPGQAVFSLAYLARWCVYFSLYVAVSNFVRHEDVHRVWGALQRCVLAFAAFGIVQAALLPDFAQIVYPDSATYLDWDPQGHRLVSTFLDPNFAGAFIVLALLVLLGQVAFGVRVAPWKLVLLVAATLLTLSRSSVLALVVGSMIIALVRGNSRRLARLGALVAMLLLPALPSVLAYAATYNKLQFDESALTRVITWTRAIQVLGDHPIIGVGFNTFGFVQEVVYRQKIWGTSAFGLDGGLLFIAVMTGLVGVSFYVAMVGSVIARARRVWRDPRWSAADRGLCLGVAAGSVALLVHSIFLNSLLYPFLMETEWVLWGLSAVVFRQGLARAAVSAGGSPSGAGSLHRAEV